MANIVKNKIIEKNIEIKHGNIKAGLGSLIGNTGEYYVIAELLKRGIIAAQTPRNAIAFDILATNGSRTVKIRVKTKSAQYDHYQWNIKEDGSIFKMLDKKDDYVVLVNLNHGNARPDFYVVPTVLIDEWLRSDFDKWANTPGARGQQRNRENKGRHLEYHNYVDKLEKYRDAWEKMFGK
jgi:hypothetical protein